ncbi:MAG TPA: magnesium chelatase domain-containing protein, partial [Pseudobdellovibrionaceae bacterium]|nr:magnesium chelatase domain-containing protein [Pseudobdellovibrionaceae bacterium]
MFIKVHSFVLDQDHFILAEVEVSLVAGLPQIIFLGLPDQAIRESAHRIKNAIRDQGFIFPKAKSIIVNIRPNHIKKTSRGLELAVAFAIL